ncbi:MAG: CRISPR-associated helicase Cas3' [Thermomicrobiales bacterium]
MVELPSRPVAHTPATPDGEWHYLDDHSLTVSYDAGQFAKAFGALWLGEVVGLLHDAGKASEDFQNYLIANVREPNRKHKTVDHKSCGAIRSTSLAGDLLPQVLFGHHGGLSDIGDVTVRIRDRQQNEMPSLDAAWATFVAQPRIAQRLADLTAPGARSAPPWLTRKSDKRSVEFFLRMLFSCLVDADHLDTEAHRDPENTTRRDVALPTVGELWARFQEDQARFAPVPGEPISEVNRIRREVYDACLNVAEQEPGFFRLTVPTGGGKTRSGLAFALRHAVEHGQSRVIVAVPFITITDQTAKVYRDALDMPHAVLEHHSGIEPVERDVEGGENAEETWRKLASQNWDAPLTVTTTVQLFESLFQNRTTACRKLHNIANSVIILDEIQTAPAHLREPLFDVFRELVTHYNVTIVLSTATQPVLDTIAPQLGEDGREIREIAPHPGYLFRALERVTYEWPCLDETWDWPRVVEEMWQHDQVLTIVNTIGDATALFTELNDEDALHLSTRMCQAHRRDVLEEIRTRLKDGLPCRVVSTQLVEAGVDLDFPVVMRAAGPLDRVVQAAGRCNREGKLSRGQAIVFATEEGHMPHGTFAHGAKEMLVLRRQSDFDPNDPALFQQYFMNLYGAEDGDRESIQPERAERNYATVAEKFRLIDDDTFGVLVKYGDPDDFEDMVAALSASVYRTTTGKAPRDLLRRAQPYMVNCRSREQGRYEDTGSIEEIAPGIWRWKGAYNPKLGLQDTRLDPEGLGVW